MKQLGFTTFVEHAPGRSVSNDELPVYFEDIAPRTGIQARNIAGREDKIEDLGVVVASKLFDRLGIGPGDCAGLVLASFAHPTPVLAEKVKTVASTLGIEGPAHAINFACSGFPAAVQLALDCFAGTDKHVLILTAEVLSRYVDWSDQNTAILFGDRCAATTLHPEGHHKILASWAERLGDPKQLVTIVEKSEAVDAWGETYPRSCIVMKGLPLYRMAPQRMFDLSIETMGRLGLRPQDLSFVCQHQANGKFASKLRTLLNSANLAHVEVANEIGQMGNVAGSSIPCALLRLETKLTGGQIVACPAVGAGPDYELGQLSHGIVVFRTERS